MSDGGDTEQERPPEDAIADGVVRSELARQREPIASDDDIEKLIRGNTQFALDLHAQPATASGNVMLSPYSISLALSMLHAGARGRTATQIADASSVSLEPHRRHAAFNALDLELESRADHSLDQTGHIDLSIVNATWGQTDHTFLTEYLDTIALHYGAGLRTLDFREDHEGSRVLINEWVEQHTNGRIEELLKPGTISHNTALVLTNTINFEASWYRPFDVASTTKGSFHVDATRSVVVDMMKQIGTFDWARVDDVDVIELDYVGNTMSMVLLVPDQGKLGALERTLDSPDALDAYTSTSTPSRIDLSMPKFEFETEHPLKESLETLGVEDVFAEGTADLSGIDGTRQLFVSHALHKTFISVDETGTEASAATGVVNDVQNTPPIEATISIDRPFLFLIRDKQTGVVLFFGRVTNPS